jgi:ADP-ribose pyrophosphatase YjhB (NUDIX family)
MTKKRVKALALGVVRYEGKILLGEGIDPSTKKLFYRPLGGSIEFQEQAKDAVVREFQEELGIMVIEPVLLGFLENIFIYNDQPGHELVMIFEVKLQDQALYQKAQFPRRDQEGRAVWKDLTTLPHALLYPTGLLALLRRSSPFLSPSR